MPYRGRRQALVWLMPPSLDEWLPDDHAARFVADVLATMSDAEWEAFGVDLEGEALGAPAYHPEVQLSVWLYGFMTGVRSTRKLEAACRDQVPYLWLTGNQRPDHNTLWRFYERHEPRMKELFRRSVRAAARTGCVDLALQAVDGTKVAGNAAKEQTFDEAGLQLLLERTEAAIADLEAQNRTHGDPAPPRLPKELVTAEVRRARIAAALAEVRSGKGGRLNLTDPDARLMKTRGGFVAGYNAQVMVSPVAMGTGEPGGLLITAVDVVTEPDDHEQLLPMMVQAAETTGKAAALTLADGGYHSGPNLSGCETQGQTVLMPEAHRPEVLEDPYHKDRFVYDAESDTYTCPEGQILRFNHIKRRTDRPEVRNYRAPATACRMCPAFGTCTRDWRQGRSLKIGAHDAVLQRHRERMATAEAQAAYQRRKELPEPVFGILKEQLGLRRFLRRGRHKVRGELLLLAAAFNLRTLYRLWRLRPLAARQAPLAATG
jgi:transposase